MGAPAGALGGRAGVVYRWESESSIAVLQEHVCQNGMALVSNRLSLWGADVAYALKNHYCADGDALSYNYSRLLFVYKALAERGETRIREAIENAAAKARNDI